MSRESGLTPNRPLLRPAASVPSGCRSTPMQTSTVVSPTCMVDLRPDPVPSVPSQAACMAGASRWGGMNSAITFVPWLYSQCLTRDFFPRLKCISISHRALVLMVQASNTGYSSSSPFKWYGDGQVTDFTTVKRRRLVAGAIHFQTVTPLSLTLALKARRFGKALTSLLVI